MKKLLFVFIAALVFVNFPTPARAQDRSAETLKQATFDQLIQTARRNGFARVIVGFKLDFQPEGTLSRAAVSKQRLGIKTAQDIFIERYLPAASRGEIALKTFTYIPYLAFMADAGLLQRIRTDALIKTIEEDKIESASLAESTPLIGATTAWASGWTGTGWNVAVLDSGTDKTHPFLVGKVVSEACYSTSGGGATSFCPGGATSSTATGSGVPCNLAGQCDHGTHVAGIVAGVGATYSGVAKGANLISIQVFTRFDDTVVCNGFPPCTKTLQTDQVLALERVQTLAGSMNIAAVNMSLGGGSNTTFCDGDMRKAAIDNLRSIGISTVAASGNDQDLNAMDAPACISSVISVGSTNDGPPAPNTDGVSTGFSNSAWFLTLLAPGQWITSSIPGGGFINNAGTSMATPHVSGAIAIMKQRKPTASVSRITSILAGTGKPITDTRNNIVKPRIDVNKAAQAILGGGPYDFDGDSKTDLSIFRPGPGEWWYLKSSNGGNAAAQFGASSDRITPADWTGDGKSDFAFWRPSTGFWFVLRSEDFSFFSFPFGASGDTPAPGDFDQDGKADAAVFRSSNSTWYIRNSSDGTVRIEQFGASGDIPVVGDYDGDARSDIGIYRPSAGQWWLSRSAAGVIAFSFGNNSDKPVQGDYTGDNKTDVAFFRPSTGEWFVLRSEDQSYYSFPFGVSTDLPAPGDYDGDGKYDATVFRPSNSTWFSQRTTAGTLIQTFGTTGDKPVPGAFVP